MDVYAIADREFLRPFRQAGRENIGVELEFPLLNLRRAPVDRTVALGLMREMLSQGFRTEETDADGEPAFLVNADGDVLSFDNSYNNFEFSMEKNPSITALAGRFYALYERVQQYLLPRGYSLCGIGTNPFFPHLTSSPVSYPIYRLIRRYLEQSRRDGCHDWPDFPAYLSSVQTHLDVPEALLPRALTLFAAMDFVRALLFSNSPAFPSLPGFEETVCFRDYLWEKSGFGRLAGNTGKVEGVFRSGEDILRRILSRSIFFRSKDDNYELIPPVTLREYLEREGDDGLRTYLSFQNVEVTRRGTLEIRSDCEQPVSEAFAPTAFHLGILSSLSEAEARMERFFAEDLTEEQRTSPERNRLLRDAVIYHYRLPAPEDATRRLLCDLVSLAERALVRRGKGEERLLAPLFARAERLSCPALEWKTNLAGGAPQEQLIAAFASPAAPLFH